jgi:uncharacterized membrane protein YdbT with pleckstrin-like domain
MAQIISPKEGEEILASLRKSLTTMSKQIFRLLLMLIPAILLLVFIQNTYVTGFSLLLLLVALTYGFYHFVVWYYDLYLITNLRIILISQKGLFTRELSEVEMAKISDVKYRISGIFATILQHGDVIISTTAGQTYELVSVPDPDEVREMILAVSEANKRHEKTGSLSAEEFLKKVMAEVKK